MKKTRKNGFYWVKDNSQWRVGEWMPDMERFKLTNGGHYSIGVLDEIDETPITRSQFKVEPGLTPQQCKEQIAKTYSYLYANMTKMKYESWDAFIGGASIQDTEDAIDEICELYTASLTSEIKGLREEKDVLLQAFTKAMTLWITVIELGHAPINSQSIDTYHELADIAEKYIPDTKNN